MSNDQFYSEVPASLSRSDLLFFLAAFAFVYTQLFQLPFTPYYFDGDPIIVTSNAIRMMNGEVMYRDFFHLAAPGADAVYAVLFSIFGVKVWILNITILFLSLAQVWLIWYFSRQFFSGTLVYLPAALFLIVGFRLYFIDGSYRLSSVVFVLSAVAVLINKRTSRNLVIAGALCGLASFFVQTRGVIGIVGILVFLVWENYRNGFHLKKLISNSLYLLLSFILLVALSHSYFLYQAGFENYYFSLVTFLREYYPSDPLSNNSAYLSDLPNFQRFLEVYSPAFAVSRYFRIAGPVLFYYLLIPFVYFAFLLVRWRRKTYLLTGPDAKLMLLCVVGLTLTAGISAATVMRLSHISIPGLILLVWLFKQTVYSRRIATVCLVLLALLGFSYIVQRQMISKNYLDMPAGRSAFLSEYTYQRYKWIGENTTPGEVFYEPFHPSYYFPFHLVNPTPMYLIRDSGYTPRFQVDAVIEALKKNPPDTIIWPKKWSKPPELRAADDNLEPLWQFVAANYELQVEFSKPLDYTDYTEGDVQILKLRK